MSLKVTKRDGRVVLFDGEKIKKAMEFAFAAEVERTKYTEHPAVMPDREQINALYVEVIKALGLNILSDIMIDVEDIQDAVERVLMTCCKDVAKGYILYREQHRKNRAAHDTLLDYKRLIEKYLRVDDWRVKENSTVPYSIGGLILSNSGAVTANYWLSEIYDKDIAEAHRNADIHLHDLSMLAVYCCGHSLRQLIVEGLGIPGKVTSKPAKHLSALCNQMVNYLGCLQNEAAGAQAFSSVDTYLAPFVRENKLSYEQVKRCIESLVYGLNTPSRWGCVKPTTRVLTTTGWKSYNELKEGDILYTYHNGQLSTARNNKTVVKQYSGDMYCFENPYYGYRQEVTEDHRVLVIKDRKQEAEIVLAKDLANSYYDANNTLPSCLEVPESRGTGISIDVIRLAAMFFAAAEFSTDSITYSAHIADSHQLLEQVRDFFEAHNLTYDFRQDGDLAIYTFDAGTSRAVRNAIGTPNELKPWFYKMNQDEARTFLAVWHSKFGEGYVINTSFFRDNLAFVNVLAGRLMSNKSNNRAVPVKAVNFNISKSQYSGEVWCPSNDHGTAIFLDETGAVFVSGQCQPPFTNFTFDWTIPPDLKDEPAFVGGKPLDYTYGDCQKEADIINKAFIEVMIEGDADGRGFSYPIPTYSITRNFDWDMEKENNRLLFTMAAKYGTPYFSNYINSNMDPSDCRAMCPVSFGTRVYVQPEGSNSPVCMKIGSVHTEQLLGKRFEVLTPSGMKPARTISVPMTDVIQVTLSCGTKVEFGKNHLQPTKDDGTLYADQLKVGMWLPFCKSDWEEEDIHINVGTDPGAECWITDEARYYQITKIEKIPSYLMREPILYCFEVDNEDQLFCLANGLITHNCRLRLDLRELRRKSGGFFGSGESTGSIGVVTINLPRLAYLSNDESDFFHRLSKMMDIVARSLVTKRKVITQYLESGLYPYLKKYLGTFNTYFSTFGVVGGNEMCLNAKWIRAGIDTEKGKQFAIAVLEFMRNRLSDYQEQYPGTLFNLEATPAESTAYRFAMHDKKMFKDIITAGNVDRPYYTNSTHLPVNYTDDIFEALDHQDELQVLYTSGTVFHGFLGEQINDYKAAATLIRRIAENYHLPYFTLSPTYSVCPNHGYLPGEQYGCPYCDAVTEVYSRITGYYRPLANWNDGKREEFNDRKEYEVDK